MLPNLSHSANAGDLATSNNKNACSSRFDLKRYFAHGFWESPFYAELDGGHVAV
jgi:hypothetical protein